MTRTIEKIEYDLERARRERDALQSTRNWNTNYDDANRMVSGLEEELSEAISNQPNDAYKTPDSV
ncbi:hypothetical protein [Lelliottia amnigena]|uniref:hypothetical protein n=1 Tax=Lelliottia amnigena TaxID=61646 RepID=UPI001C2403AC|nr:hypothetical protein [Lelliottia amnigena]QXB22626.1 hypothetical protein I6L76_04625 [Lelliottia amnigena]QXB22638.1 hypothetical protein I6L76_04685 [Lelliottia amnigena]